MKASHPLIVACSVTAMNFGLFTTLSDMDWYPTNKSLSTKMQHDDNLNNDHEGGTFSKINKLIKEHAFLKSELSALKRKKDSSIAMQKDFFILKQEFINLREQLGIVESVSLSFDGIDNKFASKSQPSTEEEMNSIEEERQRRDLERMEFLSDFLMAEVIDEPWSFDTHNFINETIDEIGNTQTFLTNVQCRTTLCVVELDHGDSSSADKFTFEFSTKVGEALPEANYFYNQHDNGSVSVKIYFARAGHELPQAEQ